MADLEVELTVGYLLIRWTAPVGRADSFDDGSGPDGRLS
jgi:hypothetical protein